MMLYLQTLRPLPFFASSKPSPLSAGLKSQHLQADTVQFSGTKLTKLPVIQYAVHTAKNLEDAIAACPIDEDDDELTIRQKRRGIAFILPQCMNEAEEANFRELEQALIQGRFKDLRGVDLSCRNSQDQTRVSIYGLELPRAQWDNIQLQYATLQRADLRGASMKKADLTGATIAGSKWLAADLTEATLDKATFSNTDMQGSILKGASLIETKLRNTRLHSAQFVGSVLTQTDLTGAFLGRANFKDAQLQETILDQANLDRADFSQVNPETFRPILHAANVNPSYPCQLPPGWFIQRQGPLSTNDDRSPYIPVYFVKQ